MLMGVMLLLALAAFAPAAGAREAADAEVVIGEVRAENNFFGEGFFAKFFGEGFLTNFFGGSGMDDDGGLTPEEAAAGNTEEPADDQYDPEADDDFGFTPAELAEGNAEEPAADDQYGPTR